MLPLRSWPQACAGGKNASFELAILSRIRTKAAQNKEASERILGLLDDVTEEGPNGQHICLVFKPLGQPLTVMRSLHPRGRFSIPMVKKVAKDLLTALAFLHDECDIIHKGGA